MKRIAILLALCATSQAAPPASFFRALHLVETSGRTTGPIIGDNGRALGPLQIHRGYHTDARIGGDYARCADLDYSRRVVTAYLQRYAPAAWASGDVVTLARIHNGGPRGASKPATVAYGDKVARLAK